MSIEEVLQALKSRSITPADAMRLIGLARNPPSATDNGAQHSPPHATHDGLSLGDIQELLVTSFAKALYMEYGEVKCDQPFVDSGLDSIIGVEWIKEINQRFQLSLPATTLYDYPTIDLFADYLLKIGNTAVVAKTQDESRPGDRGLVISKVHSLNEIALSPWQVGQLAAGEIAVKVRASGINFPDVMCVNGLYPTMPKYPFVPGFEVAGVVVAKGDAVTKFEIGDEIVGLTGANLGAHAHAVNLPEHNAVKKPKGVSFVQACSLPVAFSIVHHAFEHAHLRAGEQVLIQTATGGCGLVAVQLARLKGATCIGTSSREHKLQILRRLRVEHAIDYKTPFDTTVKELTAGRGVDVVLNMLSGEAIQRGLNCLAPSGRYLEIAVHALKTSSKLSLSHLLQNQSFHSMDLRTLQFETGRGGDEYLTTMVKWLEQGLIVPIVSKIYPFSKIVEALEFVGKAEHIGKVVLSHDHDQVTDLTDVCIQGMLEQQQRALKPRVGKPAQSTAATTDSRSLTPGAIAVIGMSGQFPKSPSLEEFWQNISAGKNCVTEISSSRWSTDEFYSTDPLAIGKTNCKWLGELEDADKFDPLFFNISPVEAQVMDPQQRLILQNCWTCIEDGGIDPSELSGAACGVFVGVAPGDYGYSGGDSGLNSNALMGQSQSILAARVSFFLNLKGPCITLDTACSSALVAIAEACNHLQLGTCTMALAGGVNVMAGPSLHIMTSKAGMLSTDGRCYTFDQRANGFVPAEGVGVVMLKRLDDAERDGDSIQAIIRGWSVNQDGKTNGITAPSATSQTQLETNVYRKFDIDPASITLMEAHGTGTKLGDPIEVRAITEAFRQYTSERGFCALGSIKSNMGHAMAAAGVAGFIKVVLALRRRQLPPTINFEHLNEHIQVEDSPFYISTVLKHWRVPEGVPRRAAVSSFGFSGTNAHVVVEEGSAHISEMGGEKNAGLPCYLVALSARSSSQLKMQANRLLRYLETQVNSDLASISYTLLCGRKHFKHRLIAAIDSLDQLRGLLNQWCTSGKAEGIHFSVVGESERKDSVLEANSVLQGFTAQCLTDCGNFANTYKPGVTSDEQVGTYREKLSVLATAYAQGDVIEFATLLSRKRNRPLSLPTYPFAQESYWEEKTGAPPQADNVASMLLSTRLHPLLQRNTSDLQGQRFSSTLGGEEFYLTDHVVSGKKVLPGVAYLEMARAAVERSSDRSADRAVMTLKNFVWVRPLVVDAATEVSIGLTALDSGDIEIEIYTEAFNGTAAGDAVLHAQGRATFEVASPDAQRIDIVSLRAKCNRSIDVSRCYAAFAASGLEYGPAHRGLMSVNIGLDSQSLLVLADVKLPACLIESSDQYVLHPSVLDSALQASIGLSLGDTSTPDATVRPALPFALEKLQVFSNTPVDAVVVIRPSIVRAGSAEDFQKLDVDVCDMAGRVCVRFQGYTSRILLEQDHSNSLPSKALALEKQTMFFAPVWTAKLPVEASKARAETGEHWVLLDPAYGGYVAELESQCPSVKWAVLSNRLSAVADADHWATSAGQQVFARVRSILQEKQKKAVTVQVVMTAESGSRIVAAALNAFLRSAHQENSKLIGQVIELTREATMAELLAAVNDNAVEINQRDHRVRYIDGVREVGGFRELGLMPETAAPWRDGGVYLITGGAGGLGLIFAREIANCTRDARIILTGRTELSSAKLSELSVFNREGEGTLIEYRVLDVNHASAVVGFVHSLLEQYGTLNGIIHCAGVTQDNFIYKKPVEEFSTVLAPKIGGTINLDRASKNIELDFLILFSSTAGVFGNVGQSDYALANAFMDAYGAQRDGRTLSINWPLWASGGMKVDSAVLEQMRREGIGVLETAEGIEAFYRAWASSEPQVIVLAGERRKLSVALGVTSAAAVATPPDSAAVEVHAKGVDTTALLERVRGILIHLISQQLKVKEDDIDVNCELSEFGFDSISLTAFGNTLNQAYGLELSPTIFFEYPTVHRFAEYLAAEHTGLLAQKLGVRTAQVDIASTLPTVSKMVVAPRRRRGSTHTIAAAHIHAPAPAPAAAHEPVAIVGMSGCFPGASDLDAFWENLKEGRHGISEIPKSRWDWQAIYGDPVQEVGKTNIKWGGFIEGVEEFDPLFFNISPLEAESMDPQHRLLMTYTWRAIEDAGYSPQSLSGSQTAIFVGTSSSGYRELVAQSDSTAEGYNSTSGVPSMGPNRMSYLLNLHGPSEPIETACSSSLVAIHRSVRAMQAGDCEQALAGGINTLITPWVHISFGKAGMLCEDGRCKTFSKDANGYVRGEGVGMLFLKKLSAAERDGDHIYGLIRGSRENHGGRANSLTAPNPKAQAELIKAACREANIDPRSISYVETHGTGTPLGDPIEINGLKSAFADLEVDFGERDASEAYCGLGSVKTNIGHLELAAGVAGVIKVLLQIKHKTLVKSLHCEQINPYINLDHSPFYLVRETQPWGTKTAVNGALLPRRAGVSSFGFGGVNAHVLIEEYCGADSAEPQLSTSEHPALIVLSAKTEGALQEQAKQLLAHVRQREYADTDLPDMAYTLQVGRDAMDHRLAFMATTLSDLDDRLAAYVDGKAAHGGVAECYRGEVRKNKDALSMFSSDEDASNLLKTWIEKGKYAKLLELWVKGYPVEWLLLYERHGSVRPRRLSLPTYPFARERYWINSSEETRAEHKPSRLATLPDGTRWLKVAEQWVSEPLSIDGSVWPALLRSKKDQRSLVLYRQTADADGIRRAFAEVSSDCSSELPIEFLQLPELAGANVAGPLDRYLLEHRAPDAVFYFSGTVDDSRTFLESELGCILRTSQALIAKVPDQAIQFHYCYPASESTASLYQQGLSGLFRAIAMECPAHCYRSIEYPSSATPQDYQSIVREWLQHSPTGLMPAHLSMVRYRQGERQRTTMTELPESQSLGTSPFRRGATYLMVGALGEVGQSVCHALARQYGCRLIILSRRQLDSDTQDRLAAIAEAGAEVIYRSVDITHETELADTFASIKQQVGAIEGVFHFARSVSDALLLSKDPASFQQTIAAKVAGTVNIDAVTAAEPLDFFIVFSSMAAFGIAGSADYGYATAFQNALVRDRNRKRAAGKRSGSSIAFCWGQWVADAYSSKDRDAVLEGMGFDFIDAPAAIRAMEQSIDERQTDDVVGAIAVRNLAQVKNLYGLTGRASLPDPVSEIVFRANRPTELIDDPLFLDDLLGLTKELGQDETAVRTALLGHSYSRLSKLYQSLTAP